MIEIQIVPSDIRRSVRYVFFDKRRVVVAIVALSILLAGLIGSMGSIGDCFDCEHPRALISVLEGSPLSSLRAAWTAIARRKSIAM